MDKCYLPENYEAEVAKKPAYILLKMASIAIESWEDIYNENHELVGNEKIPLRERSSAILKKEEIIRELPELLERYASDYNEIESTLLKLKVYIERLNELRETGRPLAPGIDYLGHSHNQTGPSVFSEMADKLKPYDS